MSIKFRQIKKKIVNIKKNNNALIDNILSRGKA